MHAIIVNADDLGLSPQVNAGICRACRHGVVTESSVLIYSPYAAEALALGAEAGLSIGLHLDLVSPFACGWAPGFGPEGRVCRELAERELEGRAGVPLSCGELTCVRDEMRRQVEGFRAMAGRLPSHLDYHFGLHYLPEVLPIYVAVAQEFDLPVRWGPGYAGPCPYPLAPDCFADRFRGVADDGVGLFLAQVDEPCAGVKEIVCHPGYATPGPMPEAYNAQRELELRALTDPRLGEELARRGVQLVDYAWLKAQRREGAPARGGSDGA